MDLTVMRFHWETLGWWLFWAGALWIGGRFLLWLAFRESAPLLGRWDGFRRSDRVKKFFVHLLRRILIPVGLILVIVGNVQSSEMSGEALERGVGQTYGGELSRDEVASLSRDFGVLKSREGTFNNPPQNEDREYGTAFVEFVNWGTGESTEMKVWLGVRDGVMVLLMEPEPGAELVEVPRLEF